MVLTKLENKSAETVMVICCYLVVGLSHCKHAGNNQLEILFVEDGVLKLVCMLSGVPAYCINQTKSSLIPHNTFTTVLKAG